MEIKQIVIVGGGASGIVAAIAAARAGADVTIIEQKEIIGKKILSTGNGRCNLTNECMAVDCFRGEQTDIVVDVINSFGVASTLRFFNELGILTKSKNGYIYPLSEQAVAILDVLTMELKRLHVQILLDTKVSFIDCNKNDFIIRTNYHSIKCNSIILATGGKAASVLGSDGSGYILSKALGHSITPVVPALVQLKCLGNYFKKIAGVRVDATVTAIIDGKQQVADTGELQLTNYGISGIPVFQISRYIAMGLYEQKQVTVSIDFLPIMDQIELLKLLKLRIKTTPHKTAEELLIGIFNQKLIPVFLQKSNIKNQKNCKELKEEQLERLINICKSFEVIIEDTNSFDQAQVCAGGVRTTEINPRTMESVFVKGLYLTGELLDIDGICGGYNLQWAWATGFIAGTNAAKEK